MKREPDNEREPARWVFPLPALPADERRQRRCEPAETKRRTAPEAQALEAQAPEEELPATDLAIDASLGWTPFPLHHLPTAIAEYAAGRADAIGVDPAFVAVPSLPVLAAAVGNAYRIRLKHGWEEPATIWAALVSPSGSSKSPALDAALEPVYGLEREASTAYNAERRAYGALPKAEKEVTPEPHRRRIRVGDTTTESLVAVHEENPRGLLLVRDELGGWLGAFDRYARGDADLQSWIEMYGGRPIVIDRKSAKEPVLAIERPNVCVTGTIQPEILRRHLKPVHLASGFAARLLLVEPPVHPKRWTEAHANPELDAAYGRLIRSLYDLPMGSGTLMLTPEATVAFADYVNENGAAQHALPDGPLKAALSKHEALAARLALIFHLAAVVRAGADVPPVPLETMQRAIAVAKWFRRETARLYEKYGIEERAVDRDTRLAANLPDSFAWQDVARVWGMQRAGAFKVIKKRLIPQGLAADGGHGVYYRLCPAARR